MSMQHAGPLQKFLSPEAGRALLLHDGDATDSVAALGGSQLTHQATGGRPMPESETPGRWPAVAAVLSDAAALRRLVSGLPRIGRTRAIAVLLVEANQPLLLTARPEWPPVTHMTARRLPDGSCLTVVRFARGVLADNVLAQFARDAVSGNPQGNGGLFVATTRGSALAADPGVVALAEVAHAVEPDRVVPPDVVLTDSSAAILPSHEVTARAPVVLGPGSGPVGPIDERVLNPRGFRKRDTAGVPVLSVERRGRVSMRGHGVALHIEERRGATASHIQALRPCHGVAIHWPVVESRTLSLVVAGLAAAGIPLIGGAPPRGVGDGLGTGLRAELARPVELHSPLRREEHSVRLRRAALLEHSGPAWRGSLARSAGVPHRLFPSCTVLLATRRPHQLRFALRQFAKQRGIEAELVLVAHGFTPDQSMVRAVVGDRPFTVLSMPEDVLFGDVLNAGLAASSGDLVMKMDDDDWYGPDFLVDLMVARLHSGADVVGTTSEYVYLDKLDRTLRRTDDSERTARLVAGGTLMMRRTTLTELGGFRRARRFVDAALLRSVEAAGGSIYRGHGLGYVLHRGTSGHTWEPGLDFFLDALRMGEEWEGFVPSALLEHDEAETPQARGA